MSARRPVGIGEKVIDHVTVKETYELPGSRRDLLALLASQLELGGVQKLVVEMGHPVTIFRAVPRDEANVPTEIPQDELFLAATHAPIQDLWLGDDFSALDHLFRAFSWLSARNQKPRALIVHSLDELRRWLEVDEIALVDEVFGIEVKEEKVLPEDTALLVGVIPGVQDKVSNSLRIPMNLPPKERK